jgi:hypothetical protein
MHEIRNKIMPWRATNALVTMRELWYYSNFPTARTRNLTTSTVSLSEFSFYKHEPNVTLVVNTWDDGGNNLRLYLTFESEFGAYNSIQCTYTISGIYTEGNTVMPEPITVFIQGADIHQTHGSTNSPIMEYNTTKVNATYNVTINVDPPTWAIPVGIKLDGVDKPFATSVTIPVPLKPYTPPPNNEPMSARNGKLDAQRDNDREFGSPPAAALGPTPEAYNYAYGSEDYNLYMDAYNANRFTMM